MNFLMFHIPKKETFECWEWVETCLLHVRIFDEWGHFVNKTTANTFPCEKLQGKEHRMRLWELNVSFVLQCVDYFLVSPAQDIITSWGTLAHSHCRACTSRCSFCGLRFMSFHKPPTGWTGGTVHCGWFHMDAAFTWLCAVQVTLR